MTRALRDDAIVADGNAPEPDRSLDVCGEVTHLIVGRVSLERCGELNVPILQRRACFVDDANDELTAAREGPRRGEGGAVVAKIELELLALVAATARRDAVDRASRQRSHRNPALAVGQIPAGDALRVVLRDGVSVAASRAGLGIDDATADLRAGDQLDADGLADVADTEVDRFVRTAPAALAGGIHEVLVGGEAADLPAPLAGAERDTAPVRVRTLVQQRA